MFWTAGKDMKTRSCLYLGLLASLLMATLAGCCTAEPKHVTLEGRWTGAESGRAHQITVEFTGNRFAYWDANNNEIGGGTFVIRDAARPMQMDLTFERIVTPEHVGKIGLAIFELNGNELTFAGAEPGIPDRPTSFSGGQGVRIFAFKREGSN